MLVDLATIAGRLREARLDKQLSQVELAQKLGVTQGTISRAELGRDMRVGTLVEIARALDLELTLVPRSLRPTVDMLVTGGDPQGPSFVYTGKGDEPYTEDYEPKEESVNPRSRRRLPRGMGMSPMNARPMNE